MSWDIQVGTAIKFACCLLPALLFHASKYECGRWYCISQQYLRSVTPCSVATITCRIDTVSKVTKKPITTCVCYRLYDHISSVTLSIYNTWIDRTDTVGYSYSFHIASFYDIVSFTEVIQRYTLKQPYVTTDKKNVQNLVYEVICQWRRQM